VYKIAASAAQLTNYIFFNRIHLF